jgi:hypothetical protein
MHRKLCSFLLRFHLRVLHAALPSAGWFVHCAKCVVAFCVAGDISTSPLWQAPLLHQHHLQQHQAALPEHSQQQQQGTQVVCYPRLAPLLHSSSCQSNRSLPCCQLAATACHRCEVLAPPLAAATCNTASVPAVVLLLQQQPQQGWIEVAALGYLAARAVCGQQALCHQQWQQLRA